MSEKALQFSKNLKIKKIDSKSFQAFNDKEKSAFSLKSEYDETRSSLRNIFFDINEDFNLLHYRIKNK